ncbi:MAG: T9SS type A sorting domain-containing protein [Bacteroidia bacterium]|nr:T9SS type A sorting domain-containing protein [Bacteroidia bacterium]
MNLYFPFHRSGTFLLLVCLTLGLPLALRAQTPLYVSHWTSASDPNLTSGSAGTVSTMTLDSVCSQMRISVTDTLNAPLLAFNAYQIDPVDNGGNQITDLSGNMRIYFRVRSPKSVRLAVQLRSGGGGSAERTDRVEFIVPADTSAWSEYIFEFTPANLAGFDSTNLRDIWFFLDRGVNNFAGNEFYLDYVSIGAAPDSATFSDCLDPVQPPVATGPLYTLHWSSQGDALFSGNAAAVTTQVVDSACSQLAVSVTDPVNAPLTAFTALILNPLDSAGNDVVDLSGNLNVNLRMRSRDSVMVGFLLRSGDGTAAFRSTLQEQLLPGDTASWTNLSFVVNASNLGGFDSTDLRDVWIYLDRGTNNFAGNEVYFDYLSIGGIPDSALNSPCFTDTTSGGGGDTTMAIQYTLHWATGSDALFSGTGAATLTQALDSACSQLLISVTDPGNVPLPAFSPIIVNPLDSAGMDIVDLSGATTIHLRARSRDSVMIGFIARSGDGTNAFRSVLQEQVLPGDTLNWTELSFTFDASTIGGFDSTDLRDLWLFLDRGTDNFAGNELYIDYFAIGEKPSPSDNSPCSLLPPFEFPYVLHWDTAQDGVFGGSEAIKLTQVIDSACSQLAVSVTDPVGDPYAGFSPMIINPKDQFGNDLVDLSGQMTFYVRVRSKEQVNLGMVLRSAGGSQTERTEPVERVVPADLTTWTELAFTFTGADYGTFDSTDLRDFWFFLDRGDPNFNGNEFYFDYVSIGSRPDMSLNSACVETVSIEEEELQQSLRVFPNPGRDNQAVQVEFFAQTAGKYSLNVYDIRGQLVSSESFFSAAGQQTHHVQPQGWAKGLYTIQLIGNNQKALSRWLVE